MSPLGAMTRAEAILGHPSFAALKSRIISHTGLVYFEDKDGDLADRIWRRLEAIGVDDPGRYLSMLGDPRQGELEFDALITELTIGETYFFRHREQFDSLRDVVIPQLLAKNASTRRLRIWSAGCSTGAEPYSVAILLKREFPQLAGWDIEILGTDINRKFLEVAQEARFDEWAFRSTEPWLRRDYFMRAGKGWLLDPSIRRWVTFRYHNLLRHPFPSLINHLAALDLIICRNVMIYFDRATYDRIIPHFEESLSEGGWLMLGHAEQTPGGLKGMRTVHLTSVTLYQKSSDPASPFKEGLSDFPWMAQDWSAPAGPEWSLPPLAPASAPPRPGPAPAGCDVERIRELADRGEFEGALLQSEMCLASGRNEAAVFFYQALALEQLGRHAESERALREAVRLDRGFVLAHYYLGVLFQRQARSQEARQAFADTRELLSGLDESWAFREADGITVRELRKMVDAILTRGGAS